MAEGAVNQGFTQIGVIIRAQGLDGELRVAFETEYPEPVRDLTLVYLQNDRGDFYPARITNLRVEEKKNLLSFFVQFEHVTDRTAAEALRNHRIFLETKDAEDFIEQGRPEEVSLVDCEVFDDNDEYLGLVTGVMENPAHPILEVATTSGSLLIPFVDHYIREVENRSIYCQNIDPLRDL